VAGAVTATADELASIVRAVEDDIIFGRLPPGQRLVEDVLMARFAATRHAVRQALAELERTGIVTRTRNIGAAVRSYTRWEVMQIYQVREMLQRQAALMIRLPAPPDLIARLEQLNDRFEQEGERGNLRGVHEANDEFHLTLFDACGNDYLVTSIASYMALSLPIRATTLGDAKSFQLSLQQHRTMITLLQGTDGWALSQLCVEHVFPSKWDYLQRLQTVEAGAAAGTKQLRPRARIAEMVRR
jgi:DNA-binding GntR family transcriptional regulator